MEAVWSGGVIIGGALVGATGGLKKKSHSILLSCLIWGVTILWSGLLPRNQFVLFVILNGIMGVSQPLYDAPATALIQQRIAPKYLGRAFALFGSLQAWAMPLGLAVSAFFIDGMSVPLFFVTSGIGMLILTLVLWLLPQVRLLDE